MFCLCPTFSRALPMQAWIQDTVLKWRKSMAVASADEGLLSPSSASKNRMVLLTETAERGQYITEATPLFQGSDPSARV